MFDMRLSQLRELLDEEALRYISIVLRLVPKPQLLQIRCAFTNDHDAYPT